MSSSSSGNHPPPPFSSSATPQHHQIHQVFISKSQKSIGFYANLANQQLRRHKSIQILALGTAIHSAIIIAEIVKSSCSIYVHKVEISTVEHKNNQNQTSKKARVVITVQIPIGSAQDEKKTHEDGMKTDGTQWSSAKSKETTRGSDKCQPSDENIAGFGSHIPADETTAGIGSPKPCEETTAGFKARKPSKCVAAARESQQRPQSTTRRVQDTHPISHQVGCMHRTRGVKCICPIASAQGKLWIKKKNASPQMGLHKETHHVEPFSQSTHKGNSAKEDVSVRRSTPEAISNGKLARQGMQTTDKPPVEMLVDLSHKRTRDGSEQRGLESTLREDKEKDALVVKCRKTEAEREEEEQEQSKSQLKGLQAVVPKQPQNGP